MWFQSYTLLSAPQNSKVCEKASSSGSYQRSHRKRKALGSSISKSKSIGKQGGKRHEGAGSVGAPQTDEAKLEARPCLYKADWEVLEGKTLESQTLDILRTGPERCPGGGWKLVKLWPSRATGYAMLTQEEETRGPGENLS